MGNSLVHAQAMNAVCHGERYWPDDADKAIAITS